MWSRPLGSFRNHGSARHSSIKRSTSAFTGFFPLARLWQPTIATDVMPEIPCSAVSVDRLHMPSALDGGGLPFPRQQFVEPIGWISIDHALEHVAQVGVGLDGVHFARFDQRAE